MEQKLSFREKFKLIMHLNKIEDPKARQAYINHRRGHMQVMLSLFATSKLIHIVHLASLMSQSQEKEIEFRMENAHIL